MENRRIIFVCIGVLFAYCSFSQEQKLPIPVEEINNLFDKIDTVSKSNYNYHIWFKEQGCDTSQLVSNIWINTKMGDEMFKKSGISICKFYPYKDGYVFIYMKSDCKVDIPSSLLRDLNNERQIDKESAFYTEEGVHKTILTYKSDQNFYHYEIIPLIEDQVLDKILNDLEDLY